MALLASVIVLSGPWTTPSDSRRITSSEWHIMSASQRLIMLIVVGRQTIVFFSYTTLEKRLTSSETTVCVSRFIHASILPNRRDELYAAQHPPERFCLNLINCSIHFIFVHHVCRWGTRRMNYVLMKHSACRRIPAEKRQTIGSKILDQKKRGSIIEFLCIAINLRPNCSHFKGKLSLGGRGYQCTSGPSRMRSSIIKIPELVCSCYCSRWGERQILNSEIHWNSSSLQL